MNFDTLKFTRSQRSGLFALMVLIVTLQLLYYFVDCSPKPINTSDRQQWLAVQTEIDSLNRQKLAYVPKLHPFNPNFITDFKGYKLGMSVAEIDRLLEFRKANRYVNSADEFQLVTKVSDSLLAQISPHFKFPEWVKNRHKSNYVKFPKRNFEMKKIIVVDINTATKEDLIKVYGIGDGLSERILKEKEKLGAFVSMEQLHDVWGLSPEVVGNLKKSFEVMTVPTVKKININKSSVKELMQFPYFRYQLAKSIVTYRSMNGGIQKPDDLLNISGFPVEKINIIALYLEF